MRRWLVLSSVLIFLAAAAPFVSAQQPQRYVTRTRLQAVFSDLEHQWLKAVQAKDAAALGTILADEFEVWSPESPATPIPREDWTTQAFARKLQEFHVRQIVVRAVSPEVSVASFILSETIDEGGKSVQETHFVVDVWTHHGNADAWRCTDRYISAAAADSAPPAPQRYGQ